MHKHGPGHKKFKQRGPGTEGMRTKSPAHKDSTQRGLRHRRNLHTQGPEFPQRGAKKLKERSLARKSPDTQAIWPNRAPSRRNLHKQSLDTEGAYTSRAQANNKSTRTGVTHRRGLHKQGPDTEGIYTERAQAQKELAQAKPRAQGVQAGRPKD